MVRAAPRARSILFYNLPSTQKLFHIPGNICGKTVSPSKIYSVYVHRKKTSSLDLTEGKLPRISIFELLSYMGSIGCITIIKSPLPPSNGRVDKGDFSPYPSTEPDVRLSRIRLLAK